MAVRIFWACILGLCVGIGARSFFGLGFAAAVMLFLLAIIVLIASRKTVAVWNSSVVCAVFLVACACGVVRAEKATFVYDTEISTQIGNTIEIEGIVSREPDVREGSVRVVVRDLRVASSSYPRARVLAILPAFAEVSYGNRVRIKGVLRMPESFAAEGGRTFDYPGYLAAQGIGYELAFAHLESAQGFEGSGVVRGALVAKQVFSRGLELSLPDPQSGLAAGITVGDKRSLGKELSEEFRRVSLVHIIVLSGYNITIVIAGVFFVLARFSLGMRFGAGVFVALLFAMMTGFAAASVRASIMASIALSGSLTGRLYAPARALGVVAAGMLVWNPLLLRYDPGFQLSIIATAGLMAFSPIVLPHLEWIRRAWLREIVAATLSAQAAVLPLLLYSSGTLSLAALPANFLVLAAVPLAMLMSVVASAGGLVLGLFAPIAGLPAYLLLSYIIGVAHVLASIPLSSVQISAFSGWWLVPVYGFMCAYVLWTQRGTQEKTAQN